MYNFTPRAQQALALARKEAENLHYNCICTEHLLIGLIILDQGVAVSVLERMGLNLGEIRENARKQASSGPDEKPSRNIPYTPRVKKVLSLANKEAKNLNHSYVGTEHILLGILQEAEGTAARILQSFNVEIGGIRNAILLELDQRFEDEDINEEVEQPTESEDSATLEEIHAANVTLFEKAGLGCTIEALLRTGVIQIDAVDNPEQTATNYHQVRDLRIDVKSGDISIDFGDAAITWNGEEWRYFDETNTMPLISEWSDGILCTVRRI